MRVFDSAMNSLKIIALFKDSEIDPVSKEYVLLRLLFPDPKAVSENIEDVNGLVAMALWETCGLDITGAHKDEVGGSKVFDWEQDEEIIKVSLFAVYGKPWEEISQSMSYRDVVSMIGLISQDTPLGQAIHYRVAEPPKQDEHNKEYVKQWRERQEFWRLKDEASNKNHIEEMNNVSRDMFLAMSKAAEDGERRKCND